MRVNRAERSLVGEWWFTVDWLLLTLLLLLMAGGLLLSLAASPPVADRLNLDHFYFVKRHAVFLGPAVVLLIAASLLSPARIRRASLIIAAVGLGMMLLTIFTGVEVKGAKRWLQIGGLTVQPSEFVKPAFVILSAWLFAEGARRRDLPGMALAALLYLGFAALLLLQPDFGQTFLVTAVWGSILFASGAPVLWIVLLAIASIAGIVAAYATMPHVQARIDAFWSSGTDASLQMKRAIQSFLQGGWFGRGPGEGVVNQRLPDSHADFIFAVLAEEYGIVTCLLLTGVFAFIVLKVLVRAMREPDAFIRLSVTGLVVMFGLQALINMAVNLGLIPTKGMTLPFISYGGSSLLSMAIGMGFVLGFTRRGTARATIEQVLPGGDMMPGARASREVPF